VGAYEEHGYDRSEGEVLRETEKAILFQQEDGEEYWVPKSVLHDNSEVWKLGDVGILIVKEWFARKMEWI
jgi:Ser-tRNA(Ala) deacylase AlaX